MSGIAVALLAGLGAALLFSAPLRFAPTVRPPSVGVIVVAVGALAVSALVRLDLPLPLIGLGVGAAVALSRSLHRRQEKRRAGRRREEVLRACESLAADLASGLAPTRALTALAADFPELAPVADAAAIGSDVPAAFRQVAALPGAESLRVAAASWSVAHRSGAGLGTAVELAAATMRDRRATARTVSTELASALATARLLAALPLGVLLLGRGTGGDPFGFLLGTIGGQCCLVTGLGLAWLGTVWLGSIADDVEKS